MRTSAILTGLTLVAVLAVAVPPSAWAQRQRQPGGGGGREASGGGGGDRAVPRGEGGSGRTSSPEPATRGGSTADSAPRSSGADASSGDREQVPPFSRSRGSRNPVGTAVAREGVPPSKDGPIIIDRGYGGYYPWGYGGFGYGGYYGGSYDPWYYGGSGYPSYYSIGYEGSLRVKVKPREASVFVDGYYVGRVDEFDGIFQRLHIESGPHRIEIRADGYEPLSFEIRLQPGRTITYTGELKRLP